MTEQQRPDRPKDLDASTTAGVDPSLTAGQAPAASQPTTAASEPVNDGSREPIRVAPAGGADASATTSSALSASKRDEAASSQSAAERVTEAGDDRVAPHADAQPSQLDEALARSRAIPADGELQVPPADYDAAATQHTGTGTTTTTNAAPAAEPVTTETVTEPQRETVVVEPTPVATETEVTETKSEPVATTERSERDVDAVIAGDDRTSTEGLVMPPEQRQNRGFAVFTAIIASLVFAAVLALGFSAAAIIYGGASGNLVDVMLGFIGTAAFFIPVALFTIFMVLWSLVANRAGWWSYIIASLLVAVLVFFGYHLGIAAQDVVNGEAFSFDKFLASLRAPEQLPGALISFIAAREAALWIGGIASLRGRRVKRKNAEAQAEYERKVAEERELSVAV